MEKWIPCSWIVYNQYTLDNISHVIQYEYDFVELVLSSIDYPFIMYFLMQLHLSIFCVIDILKKNLN